METQKRVPADSSLVAGAPKAGAWAAGAPNGLPWVGAPNALLPKAGVFAPSKAGVQAAWPKGRAPKGEGVNVPKERAARGLPKGAACGRPNRPPEAPGRGGPP
jgi:hypothetical protein